MRKEPFGTGDYVHVFNRGNRKMDIVRDENDRWRFLTDLRFYNDKNPAEYIIRSYFAEKQMQASDLGMSNIPRRELFAWPNGEDAQKPIVAVIAFCLLSNHYHLLLREIIPGGITTFIRKLDGGFTKYTNSKYGESGKIFQGSYHARRITDVRYLQYVDAYIQVLNTLEFLLSKNISMDSKIDLKPVIDCPFSSLGESLGYRDFSILDREATQKKYKLPATKQEYEKLMRSVMAEGGLQKILGKLAIDIKP